MSATKNHLDSLGPRKIGSPQIDVEALGRVAWASRAVLNEHTEDTRHRLSSTRSVVSHTAGERTCLSNLYKCEIGKDMDACRRS